jgi:hypothetical protein
LPPGTVPTADALVGDVVVAPPRGSVLVGAVDVVLVDAFVVVVVPLVFFVPFGGIFGSVVVVVVVVLPVVAFSTSWAEASCCSIAMMSAWYCCRFCAFSAACAFS